jgi:hypothetical protein
VGPVSGLVRKRKWKMTFGCTISLSLIWLFRLVAWYMKNLSTVFMNLPLLVNSRGVMIVCMGQKE